MAREGPNLRSAPIGATVRRADEETQVHPVRRAGAPTTPRGLASDNGPADLMRPTTIAGDMLGGTSFFRATAALAFVLATTGAARAQDLEPKAYSASPVGAA